MRSQSKLELKHSAKQWNENIRNKAAFFYSHTVQNAEGKDL